MRFVVLADGSRVVEKDGDPEVAPLAKSVELTPPYRVEAVRRAGTTWAVGARKILVAELSEPVLGDEIELAWDGAERSTRIDGAPRLGSVLELETLAASRFDTWVVRAHRLRGAHWEVEIDPL